MARFTYLVEDRTGTKHYGSASSIADARALADFHDPNPGPHPRVVILREGKGGRVTEVSRRAEPRPVLVPHEGIGVDAVRWIREDADDRDIGRYARARTLDVAEGLGIPTKTAYKLLQRAAAQGLVTKHPHRAALHERTGGGRADIVGWAMWEVNFAKPEDDPHHGRLRPA